MSRSNTRLTIPAEQFEAEAALIRSLTFRERDVSVRVAEGMSNRQIGETLFISAVTVRHHLSSIFRKLEIGSRFELIVLCYRHRLIVPPMIEPPAPPQREITHVASAAGAAPGRATSRASR
jgi:DNA-binding NarL/FixJ family response regulator